MTGPAGDRLLRAVKQYLIAVAEGGADPAREELARAAAMYEATPRRAAEVWLDAELLTRAYVETDPDTEELIREGEAAGESFYVAAHPRAVSIARRYAELFRGLSAEQQAGLASCMKCGGRDVYTRWDPDQTMCPFFTRDRRRGREADFMGEHLHRTCRVCGWEWADCTVPDSAGTLAEALQP